MTRSYAFAPPLLDIRALSVRFNGTPAVSEVSLQLAAGEILALVGESGSGKSTIALAIPRLLPPSARMTGQILVRGEDMLLLAEDRLHRRRGVEIGMIFQDPAGSLNPLMTVGEQISETLRAHLGLSASAARRRAVELLDQVHILEPARHARSYPHELSGGMKQRAMIAIAIACGPKLLIADEPTTALDSASRRAVLELLHQLRQDLSLGILLISHDLGMVAEWADRVAVLYAGRVCEDGEADAIFVGPRHPYTRGLLAASPLFSRVQHYSAGALVEIPGSPPRPGETQGCAFAPRCAEAQDSCRLQQPPLLIDEAEGNHRLACPVALPQARFHDAAAAE
jgi:peptide/nickel transport system ATP-binding protein